MSWHGSRLLIGVATYSERDLKLLDLLAELLEQREENLPHIDVFDTLDCKSQQDFDKYIPGIGKVFQTPVAGYWQDAILQDKAWGKSARDLVEKVCKLEPSTLNISS
jgi:hypothetical protein